MSALAKPKKKNSKVKGRPGSKFLHKLIERIEHVTFHFRSWDRVKEVNPIIIIIAAPTPFYVRGAHHEQTKCLSLSDTNGCKFTTILHGP